MANAWCINAIWFDWCFLQTLQQLDSACIWVWVQYTAPDPLDDKRLDYITYTDKCWCSCCLSWENEILIYATQWTLKNLTLTNESENEVVNVKRTDLFWSNRAKTVVRYKTWWYPTSITDWTLAVEETTKNQYESAWYDVSWLDDWTQYYFTAFALDSNNSVIDSKTSSITTDFWIPAEYQEVAYIQNTWTQYINTWLFAWNNIQVETKIEVTSTDQDTPIFWSFMWWSWTNSLASYYHLTPYNSKFYYWLDWSESNAWSYSATVWTQYTIIFNNSNKKLIVNNSELATLTWTTWYSWTKLWIGRRWQWWNPKYWKFKYFYFKMYDKNTWQYVRDFVPCYRVSDGVIWMYDKVNKQFYTNAWSWTFQKWDEVVSTRSKIQEVEYIESSATQVLNSWLVCVWTTLNVYMKFVIVRTNPTSWQEDWFFGWKWTSNQAPTIFLPWSSPKTLNTWFWSWTTQSITSSALSLNTIHILDITHTSSQRYWTIDWTSFSFSQSVAWWANNNTTWHFAFFCDWSTQYYYSSIKLYKWKITINWTLRRDFTPCYIKKTWIIWMRDEVEWKFYWNKWTWAFTKWADV